MGIFKSSMNDASAGGGGRGEGLLPPENLEILILLNSFSSFLRRNFLSKMFAKSIFIIMPIFICQASCASTRFYFIFCAVFKVFCILVSVMYTLLLGVLA